VFDPRGPLDPRGPFDPRGWYYPGWGAAAAWYGYAGEPVSYGYGDTVTYQDGTVYYGDEPYATAAEYYEQATEIAASVEPTQNEDWLPLGVFYLVADASQTSSDKMVNLAINRDGAVAGVLYDQLTQQQTQLTGAVDKEAQRVAVRIEGDDSLVAEMGLYNLTEAQVPVLLHFGPDRQESRLLIRAPQPEDQTAAGGGAAAATPQATP
jgi:hypothetical protein